MPRCKPFLLKVVLDDDQPRSRKNVRRRLDLFLALDIQLWRVGYPKEDGVGVRYDRLVPRPQPFHEQRHNDGLARACRGGQHNRLQPPSVNLPAGRLNLLDEPEDRVVLKVLGLNPHT